MGLRCSSMTCGVMLRTYLLWLITCRRMRFAAREAVREVIKEDVDDRCRVERQNLTQQQASNHCDTKRPANLGSDTSAEGQGYTGEQRGHGCHHDGPEPQQARLVDGFGRGLAVLAFGLEREVDHHDAVLLHDTD